ncbi:uncharacterized protein TNCT_639391 [Trichonephila clavata]|uniref:Uncharacterized protein n=1 Tax=Trichonephila clavata TaxID=2740835 RepID=A0A8X6HME7_TRICU|nr:uncharacterized protein TNCT_639391 [Trichonephila clavata]
MEREHTQDKYSSTSIGAIKEQVDVVGNAYKNLSHNLKELSDSASNIIKLIQEQKVLKKEIYELRKEELRVHYRREKASNKVTVKADNKKRVAAMEEKVNENDINIKSLCNEEKVKELNKNVENSLTKFDREIDKLETKVRNAGYETPDKSSKTGKLMLTVVKKVKELIENLKNTFVELRNKMTELREKTKHGGQEKNLEADKSKAIENDSKIKSLSTGVKIRELSENIQSSLIDFKREVAKLETKVKSLEKGQAPKLPHQIVKPSFGPSETVIKSFEDIKGYLYTLAKNVDNHGIYEGSKEYLQRVVNHLDGFYIMESDKLQKLKINLNKPDLTKERFTQIITALVNTIDSSNIGKFDNRLLEKATNYIYSVEDLAKEAVSKISSSAKDLYRKVTKSGSFNLNKGYESSELQGKYRVTEKLVADLESEQKKAKALKSCVMRLFNQDGTLYDTSGKSSKGKAGEVAYGLTLDGRLVTHEHIVPYGSSDKKVEYGYYHSSLLGGKPGQCFGMMTVKNGQITKIDINSGHYKPTQENLYNAVKILQNVIADGAEIISHDFSYDKGTGQVSNPLYKGNKEQFLQRMETKGKDGLTMPERYFGALRNYNAAYKEKLDKSSHAEKIINERKK